MGPEQSPPAGLHTECSFDFAVFRNKPPYFCQPASSSVVVALWGCRLKSSRRSRTARLTPVLLTEKLRNISALIRVPPQWLHSNREPGTRRGDPQRKEKPIPAVTPRRFWSRVKHAVNRIPEAFRPGQRALSFTFFFSY